MIFNQQLISMQRGAFANNWMYINFSPDVKVKFYRVLVTFSACYDWSSVRLTSVMLAGA